MPFILCTDSTPQFLRFFDLSVAPQLLYYSYLPVIILSLFLGIFIYIKDRHSVRSKYLLFVSVAFVLWVLNIIFQWTIVYANMDMFSWQITALIEVLIPIFVFYFYYSFVYNRKLPKYIDYIAYSVIALVAVLLSTRYNMASFDTSQCQANVGVLLHTLAGLEIFTCVAIATLGGIYCFSKKHTSVQKRQTLLLAVGSVAFLLTFSISNIAGFVTNVYQFNLYGPIGMVVFLTLLAFMIVRYKTFNMKTFSAQVLIFALIALIGSELFLLQSIANIIIVAITLVITGFIGINLMRSVKKEITLREQIEVQEKKLEVANERLKELDVLKSEFVSLATHQIRAPLSAIKGYLSEVFEGDFGPVSKELEKPMHIVSQSTENLINIVGDFLNISRIESGSMKYERASLDFKQVVEETLKGLKPIIARAGLELKMDIKPDNYEIYADIGKVKQVIGNLVDNSIKYTPKGSLTITLKADHNAQKVLFAITDTGIGIAPDVIPKLFQKFTRAKNANEVNIIGTGLGLYVAKLMIEGQRGRVWAESAGAGSGSTFFVELPVAHVS